MPQQPPPLRVLLGIALIAGATLALQVLLTRLFSAVLFYHFGFLAISLALLGIGAGALAIYVRPGLVEGRSVERLLAWSSIAFALLLPAVTFALVRIDYTYTEVTAGFVGRLGLACVLATVPFLAAGVTLAVAIRSYTPWIGRVYAFDLGGAALGAAAIVPFLWAVSAPNLSVALAGAGALAALLFSRADRAAAGVALAIVAGACLLAAGTSAYQLVPNGPAPAVERWTPISRIMGYTQLGPASNGVVTYDRVIGEIVPYRRGTKVPDWRRTQEGPQSVGYEVTGPGETLIIGGGGGRDILTALSQRQRVDVIELNRGIRDVVDNDLRAVSGAPYSLPGVTTVIGDGRSTLARRDAKYDQVHLGFTDTYSANSAQAFALTENNLYTLEAFEEYLDHLEPGGVLSVSRPTWSGNEALRATVMALEALRKRGVEEPERHVIAVQGQYTNPFNTFGYATVIAKRDPFTDAEVARLRGIAEDRAEGLAYAPGGPYRGDWARLAAAESPRAFCEGEKLDLCPPTDDRPFFFNLRRIEDMAQADTRGSFRTPDPVLTVTVTLLVLLVLAALAFVLPLWLVRKEGRPPPASLLFFAAIGVGFLVLEVALIQRFVLFLGFPTYALSVVLFSLLLFTGAGAHISSRAGDDGRRWLTGALAAAVVLIVAAAFGLQPLLRALIDLPFALRVAATVAVLAPAGVLLGMAMPIGLQRIEALHPGAVTWAWAINGIASVVAAALAVVVAIEWGFDVATLVAAACYLGALLHVVRGEWPGRGAGPPAAATAEPIAPATSA